MILVFIRGQEDDKLIGVVENDEVLLAEDQLETILRTVDDLDVDATIEVIIRSLLINSTYVFTMDVPSEKLEKERARAKE